VTWLIDNNFFLKLMITAPYGSWHSPITGESVATAKMNLDSVLLDGEDTYWLESRPQEQGRMVIMHRNRQGHISQITPAGYSVRNRVHEYGGGAYTAKNGEVYFCNDADQCIYRQIGEAIQLASPAIKNIHKTKARRYADLLIDSQHRRLICVYEDHQAPGLEAINAIVSISLDNPEDLKVIVAGADFYASPCLSPDGKCLAWLSWNHPNMPWDGTVLVMAKFQRDGSLSAPEFVAGGVKESVFQPQWSATGVLYFVSDRTGWGNLYAWSDHQISPLFHGSVEFGLPQWVFGQSTYGFAGEQIVCTYTQGGIWHLALFDLRGRQFTEIDTSQLDLDSYTEISQLRVTIDRAVFVGASPDQSPAIVQLTLADLTIEVLKSQPLTLDRSYISQPQTIAFPTPDSQIAYAFYYPPTNPGYQGPAGSLPPLLVKSHGGPTGATSSQLNMRVQYWTSRGFGYLDVNYRGSTGYGRAYMEKLASQWGLLDVTDCIAAAEYIVTKGLADPHRLAISGGSAGGYTTLCALTFHRVFQAGASHYGIGDLEALAKDTHKFESRYLDKLVAPYPAAAAVYKARSPINFPEKLACPTIFFQGLEDAVVPPSQAESMVDALDKQGVPVAYVSFPGEQHGFRQAANIQRALEGEFYFYSRIFDFEPGEAMQPVEIKNF
jgi:dipeptidyl aminopeptidase/acylaminoacyl peptidase